MVLPPGWWQQHATALRRALEQSTTFDEACERIRRELGVSVSRDALRSGCMRAGLPTPSALLGVAVRARIIAEASTSFAPASAVLGVDDDDPPTLPSQRLPPSPYSATEPPAPMPRAKTLHGTRDAAAVGNAPPRDDVRRLLDATRRAPVPFADLCDLLDLSPRKCRELVEGAQQAGYAVSVDHGEVSFRLPDGGQEHVVDVAPACLLTAMNAALALVSFSWAESALIRTFGFAALLAVGISYMAVAVVVPTLAALQIGQQHDGRFHALERLHPAQPHQTVADIYYKDYLKEFPALLTAGWGFGVETATQSIRLVLSRVFEKHPKLKIVLGHLGETLPFLVWRVDHAIARPGAAKTISFRDIFCHNFWITTSGNFSNPALMCCVQEMGVDRILFAVDWPFVMNPPGVDWMATVPLCDEDKAKILSGNARKLLKLK